MLTAMFVILGLLVVGLVALVVAAARAPLGYQDEGGFHFGLQQAVATGESKCDRPASTCPVSRTETEIVRPVRTAEWPGLAVRAAAPTSH